MIRLARPLSPPSPLLWAILFGYFATRLTNLGLLPMVSDEGTYVTWGVRALFASSIDDWLASIEDGKQPLLAWLMPPLLALIEDRLIAGRLVSVGTGLANLSLLVVLGRRLFGKYAGWVAGALYVFAPIALVHDRMALYDSLVATTALLTLLTAVWWAERPNVRHTVWLGFSLGVALLTKLSAVFFVALVPVAIGLWQWRALRHWWLLAQSFFLAAACYSVLYLSPIVDNIQDGNFQRYSLTTGEVLQFPLELWLSNARFVAQAATAYLGIPLAVFTAVAAAAVVVYGPRGGRLAVLWAMVPLIAFVLTAKIIYSRYVVFCFVVALLPASWAIVTLGRGLWRTARQEARLRPVALLLSALFWCLLCLPGAVFAFRLLTDPPTAPWMDDRRYITDRFQYVESNYAGYGLEEIVEYVRERAKNGP
ncbi:MAG TPA: glycosyltransferase family 39 protein, partial [Chloroflexota bacterium]|nr:glycosyltransferase family 39 protein [Chloroflexota bacterium]